MAAYKDDYLGHNFIWFVGEIEDRKDPLKLGRARVRCFGWHTQDKEELKTSSLPWASTVQPVTAPATTSSGLVEGTWVFGFFMDGEKAQRPMIMGIIPGYRYDEQGANGESELPRGARAEADYPSFQSTLRAETRITGIGLDPYTEDTWDEPEEPDDKEYPYVQTIGSESGAMTEIITSPDSFTARKVEYDGVGGYEESQSNGNKIIKIAGSKYEIVCGDNFVNLKGSVNLTIDGNCKTNIGGNWDINVAGNKTETIGGTHAIYALGVGTYVYGRGKQTQIVTGGESRTVLAGGVIDTVALGGRVTTTIGPVLETTTGTFARTITGATTDTINGAYVVNVNGGLAVFSQGHFMNLGTGSITSAGTITAVTMNATTITGSGTVSGSVVSGSIVQQGSTILGAHIHTGVTTGPGVSGPPV
jgi:hypothetical protein